MIEYLSKNMLQNVGFKLVENKKINNNQFDLIFIYEYVNNNGDIDLKEAKHKFNTLFEFFKNDIKEVYNETGLKHLFKIKNDCFIISLVYD